MKVAKLLGLVLTAGALALGRPALAAPDYNEELIQSLAKIYDTWAPGVATVMTTPGKTYADMKAAIKTHNDNLVAFLRTRQCKDAAHAQHIEKEIHKYFHEWYGTVAPDIKHGVNMSCSADHKLVPTLWITDFKLLPKWEAGVKKDDATKTSAAKPDAAKPDAAKPDPAKDKATADLAARTRREAVTKIAKWWGQEETGDMAWWRNHPRDFGQESKLAMKHLRASTARAAKELGDVACDGDDKLPAFTETAFADGARVSADMIRSSVFTVACSGGKLRASVKIPSTP